MRSNKINWFQAILENELVRACRKSHSDEDSVENVNQSKSKSSTPIPILPEPEPEPEFYNQLKYFETRPTTNDYTYAILIKTMKHLNLQIDGTKQKLIDKIKEELKNQLLIQEAYQNLKKCNNQQDFYDFTDIDEIPKEYLFIFMCGDKMLYAMDLRSLNSYFSDKERALNFYGRSIEYLNPYNRQAFSSSTLCAYRQRIKELKDQDKPLTYPQDTPSAEQDINFKAVELFNEISNYGYIVDPSWILNLDLENLRKLYLTMDDIWNRRFHISIAFKRTIHPSDPNIFSLGEYFQAREFNLQRLQYFLINKFTSFVTNGVDRESRIMAINYILMGLGEVCNIDTVMTFN